MTTKQAANRLGVGARHLQRLVADGDLVSIGADRIDARSVAQWLTQRAGSHDRTWQQPTTWAAVALLEGLPAPWLGQAQRPSLRAPVRDLDDAEFTARARNRADVLRYHAHPRGNRPGTYCAGRDRAGAAGRTS